MSRFAQPAVLAFDGLVSALLPAPERDRWSGRRGVRAPTWSVALGAVEFFVGVPWFVLGGVAFVRAASAAPTDAALAAPPPGLTSWHFQAVAAVFWLAWFLHPASWPAAYLWLMGVVRFGAYGISHEAVGEPLVWAAVRGVQAASRVRRRRELERRYGPLRPDRARREADGSWTVVACRQKPEWDDGTATILVGEAFFRIAERRERPDGRWMAWVYRLERHPEGNVIRKLVRYESPDMLH